MAEVLGITASVIAILQISASVVSVLNDVKNASRDSTRILVEISGVQGILSTLRDLVASAESTETWLSTMRSLDGPNGPLAQFKVALEQLAADLKPLIGLKKAGRALIWPFKKKDVAQILGSIERQKTLFILALQNDHVELSRVIGSEVAKMSSSVQVLRQKVHDDKEIAILQWLSTLRPEQKHRDICARRLEGTGQWLLDTNEFQSWCNESPSQSILWCHGIPGAGKTILSSLVIDHLKLSFPIHETGIAFVYCDYRDQEHQQVPNMMASILRQLAGQLSFLPRVVNELYDRLQRQNERPQLKDLELCIEITCHEFRQIFIVVDALDECDSGNPRRAFLQSLKALQKTARLFITSRPHPEDIRRALGDSPQITVEASDSDIRKYVTEKIDEDDIIEDIVDNALKEEIIKEIVNNAQGMFLLPALQISNILSQSTKRGMRKALKQMPTGLDAVFEETLKRVQRQPESRAELGMNSIMWICHAKRLLLVEELCQALSVHPEDTSLDQDGCPLPKSVIECSGGLITIEEKTFRFIHFSIQEFLRDRRKAIFPQGEEIIVTTCLTYLLFDDFEADPFQNGDALYEESVPKLELIERTPDSFKVTDNLDTESIPKLNLMDESEGSTTSGAQRKEIEVETSAGERIKIYSSRGIFLSVHDGANSDESYDNIQGKTDESDGIDDEGDQTAYLTREEKLHSTLKFSKFGRQFIQRYPFIRYAANEWSHHEKDGPSKENQNLSLKLMNRSGHLRNSMRFIKFDRSHPTLYSPELFPNFDMMTPLHAAAALGLNDTVRLLLERKDADIDARDEANRTPLFCAARTGHVAVMRFLVSKGASIRAKDTIGMTALHAAANADSESAVNILLQNNASVDAVDKWGRSALFSAVYHRWEKVNTPQMMTLMIEAGANVNLMSEEGTTLHYVAANGLEQELLMLIRSGADINVKDKKKKTTALHHAVRGRQEAIARLLLKEGANIEAESSMKRTPLLEAAYLRKHYIHNRHLLSGIRLRQAAMIHLLLDAEANVKAEDVNGRTVLHTLSGFNEAATKIAIEKGANVNAKDRFCRTPLHMAAMNDELLYSKEDLREQKAAVQWLINAGADVQARDSNGKTALHNTRGGNGALVQLLVQRKADVTAQDVEGRTALHEFARASASSTLTTTDAIAQECLISTQALLDAGANVETKDKKGLTALAYATGKSQYAFEDRLIKLLRSVEIPRHSNGPISSATSSRRSLWSGTGWVSTKSET